MADRQQDQQDRKESGACGGAGSGVHGRSGALGSSIEAGEVAEQFDQGEPGRLWIGSWTVPGQPPVWVRQEHSVHDLVVHSTTHNTRHDLAARAIIFIEESYHNLSALCFDQSVTTGRVPGRTRRWTGQSFCGGHLFFEPIEVPEPPVLTSPHYL